jgi:hypothetical protein
MHKLGDGRRRIRMCSRTDSLCTQLLLRHCTRSQRSVIAHANVTANTMKRLTCKSRSGTESVFAPVPDNETLLGTGDTPLLHLESRSRSGTMSGPNLCADTRIQWDTARRMWRSPRNTSPQRTRAGKSQDLGNTFLPGKRGRSEHPTMDARDLC